MFFRNTTHLNTGRLERMFRDAVAEWPFEGAQIFLRYSRGADFSGACYYESDRIFINLGRHNHYPYLLKINVARPRSNRTHWWRELYTLEIKGPEELALFIFLHEFYHRLVKRARRNVRQKEARCDRFATRALVDRYGCIVRDSRGRLVPRDEWDFQDLDGFVAAARGTLRKSARKPLVRRSRPEPEAGQAAPVITKSDVASDLHAQGLLFPV
ncbi:MAG TPA: hypothetical protein VNT79_05450 [Phycisphaerae bacterium]|nr:hypothetical protein [Phycisphaerae bacterium]